MGHSFISSSITNILYSDSCFHADTDFSFADSSTKCWVFAEFVIFEFATVPSHSDCRFFQHTSIFNTLSWRRLTCVRNTNLCVVCCDFHYWSVGDNGRAGSPAVAASAA
jgi:hypothetical protein